MLHKTNGLSLWRRLRRAGSALLFGTVICSSLLAQASAQSQTTDNAHIRIGAGDLLQLTVFDEPELAQSIRVSDTGGADLMLLGSLHVAGLSTSEAQAMIEKLLRDRDYVLNPHVSIAIQEYGTQGVSVLGEVRKPGVYRVLGSRNLLDILSEAGGTTPVASNQATVQRRSGKKDRVTTSLSNNPDELLASQVNLEPGDTVIVPRAGIVYVLGEVARPGGFVMQNNGNITLMQAVALAAGVSHTAAQAKTRIVHKTAEGVQETTVNLKRVLEGKDADVKLQAEDIVYIPSSVVKAVLNRAPQLTQTAASAAVYQGIQAMP